MYYGQPDMQPGMQQGMQPGMQQQPQHVVIEQQKDDSGPGCCGCLCGCLAAMLWCVQSRCKTVRENLTHPRLLRSLDCLT